jgi:hypothetical protein
MSIKNSNDTIGNRTRDLPACSAMPQPAAPPRASMYLIGTLKLDELQSYQRKINFFFQPEQLLLLLLLLLFIICTSRFGNSVPTQPSQ